jgi:hypothetical protein
VQVVAPVQGAVLPMDSIGGGRAADHEGAFWTFVNETNEWEMPAMLQDPDWSAFFEWAFGPQDGDGYDGGDYGQ